MLSPRLRKKVHNLWSLFWSAGISNPLAAIEQITYLLFIRQLEGLDNDRKKEGKPSIYDNGPEPELAAKGEYQKCRWSTIRQDASFDLLNGTVFPWLRWLEQGLDPNGANGNGESRKLHAVTGRLQDAYFILDPNKTDTLTRSIGLIDDLFGHLNTRSANADIMGDIFEHLLEEVKESGKNGQFRTPRHIIRFMVELLDPKLDATVMDPACGSAGFLLNTLLHWKAANTDFETLKLEWDGTPHNLLPVWPGGQRPDFSRSLHGFDNDRTMVRIAWMNLLLHGLDTPDVTQLDSLSKRLPKEQSGSYRHVLANPPFTGSVDIGDLSTDRERFPAVTGNKPANKSELLFVWLILDLLEIGGRAAVIVPDGVLFGNTKAHRALRRQLLFENTLEAVVSLPGNVFQPYSGVKTSILVFQKAELPGTKFVKGAEPRTSEVWFYEVADEAYSLDQKRKARFGQDNDLFDALEKYRAWSGYLDGQANDDGETDLAKLREDAVTTDYWQPDYWEERWRPVDDAFLKIFPDKDAEKDKTFAIHELWPDLPRDPREAEAAIVAEQGPRISELFERHCIVTLQAAYQNASKAMKAILKADEAKRLEHTERAARDLANRVNRVIRDENLLERDFDQYGLNALRPLLDQARQEAHAVAAKNLPLNEDTDVKTYDMEELVEELRLISRELAKLDGYNVWRRSADAERFPGKQGINDEGEEQRVPTLQSWIVPVRVWAPLESWGIDPETSEEIDKATHDGEDVLPEYLEWLKDQAEAFDDDGTLKSDHLFRLVPDCLEALDFNLSAGRHKPFNIDPREHRPPVELIAELDAIHAQIRERLARLLTLLECET